VPFLNRDLCLEHVLKAHKDLVEGLYPAFIGSQQISKHWSVKTNRINGFNTMKASELGAIVLPFEHLNFFCQIGSNLTEETPIYILSVGKKQSQSN